MLKYHYSWYKLIFRKIKKYLIIIYNTIKKIKPKIQNSKFKIPRKKNEFLDSIKNKENLKNLIKIKTNIDSN